MRFDIYTDGSCDPNPGLGSFGYVKINQNKIVEQFVDVNLSLTTNNRMEYKAIIKAISSCETDDEVTVYSDSMLAVNTYNLWMDKWFSSGKISKKKNQDLVHEMFVLKKIYPRVKLEWVKGHAGNFWNETVDKLVFNALQTKLNKG